MGGLEGGLFGRRGEFIGEGGLRGCVEEGGWGDSQSINLSIYQSVISISDNVLIPTFWRYLSVVGSR